VSLAKGSMYVKATVFANRKTTSCTLTGPHRFEIHTALPAERNLANESVCKLIAHHYGVPQKSVRIVNGHHHPKKLIEVIQED
jgi:uncharacterized protein YggU (UPF0235/DUF167 family)